MHDPPKQGRFPFGAMPKAGPKKGNGTRPPCCIQGATLSQPGIVRDTVSQFNLTIWETLSVAWMLKMKVGQRLYLYLDAGVDIQPPVQCHRIAQSLLFVNATATC